jgi:hypothetical protein
MGSALNRARASRQRPNFGMQATPISIVPLHLRYRGAPDAER